jgi:23S rRNA (guanosine2251-2'-O)-methyltransferase
VTKDRPRNRLGKDGKSGGFPRRNEAKPWARKDDADRPQSESQARFQAKPVGASRGKFPGEPERRSDDRSGDRPAGGYGKPHGLKSRPPHSGQWERRDAAFEESGEVWIWGLHAAGAALANRKRKISKALVSRNAARRAGLDPEALPKFAELLDPKEIDQRLPPGAVHQGLAVRCAPLDGPDISDAAIRPERPLVILDQLTDPQNVGAVFRSAAAFGVAGVVMQTRNAPLLGGALAKAAAGAVERVDEIRAVNLSRAIDTLVDAGWRVVGLDGSAEQTLDQAFAGPEPLAIVLGAEGAGIRPGVAKACSGLARIPIGAGMESLNVSNAAAIAFYEAARRHGAAPPPAKAPSVIADDEGAELGETD